MEGERMIQSPFILTLANFKFKIITCMVVAVRVSLMKATRILSTKRDKFLALSSTKNLNQILLIKVISEDQCKTLIINYTLMKIWGLAPLVT